MSRIEKSIFTNMCMIYDDDGNVLVQDRTDSGWSGIAFPGGHVEEGEAFADAVIREVFEETGLVIREPELCGVKEWFRDDETRYVVMLYKTNKFEGRLTASEEGEVYWTRLGDLEKAKLASGMHNTLKIYLNKSLSEQFFYMREGKWFDLLK